MTRVPSRRYRVDPRLGQDEVEPEHGRAGEGQDDPGSGAPRGADRPAGTVPTRAIRESYDRTTRTGSRRTGTAKSVASTA